MCSQPAARGGGVDAFGLQLVGQPRAPNTSKEVIRRGPSLECRLQRQGTRLQKRHRQAKSRPRAAIGDARCVCRDCHQSSMQRRRRIDPIAPSRTRSRSIACLRRGYIGATASSKSKARARAAGRGTPALCASRRPRCAGRPPAHSRYEPRREQGLVCTSFSPYLSFT